MWEWFLFLGILFTLIVWVVFGIKFYKRKIIKGDKK